MSDKLLNKKEAAAYLRLSTRTVDRMRAAKTIRAIKVRGSIRFRLQDLDEFLKSHFES